MCYGNHKKANFKDTRKISTCLACGREYRVEPGSKGKVCSMKCWGAIQTKFIKGHSTPRGLGGKRADLGDVYFRSRWEANWARYLNWMITQKLILRWEFEPETFEFCDIKKGTRFYTPDFKVFLNDGSFLFHEVKGWMTPESATKIKRFKSRFPQHKLELVDGTRYRTIARQLGSIINGWESNRSHGKF